MHGEVFHLPHIQVSSVMPSTFICTVDNLRQLSKTIGVYQTVRNIRDMIAAVDNTYDTTPVSVLRCAWVNSHVLGNCTNLPPPQSQDSRVIRLESTFSCSQLEPVGSYGLCSNV